MNRKHVYLTLNSLALSSGLLEKKGFGKDENDE
jgi:hypothetical protein